MNSSDNHSQESSARGRATKRPIIVGSVLSVVSAIIVLVSPVILDCHAAITAQQCLGRAMFNMMLWFAFVPLLSYSLALIIIGGYYYYYVRKHCISIYLLSIPAAVAIAFFIVQILRLVFDLH